MIRRFTRNGRDAALAATIVRALEPRFEAIDSRFEAFDNRFDDAGYEVLGCRVTVADLHTHLQCQVRAIRKNHRISLFQGNCSK